MTAIGFNSISKPSGQVSVRKIGATVNAPLSWKVRNTLRWGFIKGWLAARVVAPFANAFGLMTAIGDLQLKVRRWYDDLEREHFVGLLRQGRIEDAEDYAKTRTYWQDYGIVSYRVVTDAGVAYLVDDFDNGAGSADVSLFNFHGIGTTNTAEAAGDTALANESTTALNPDNTRATGTRSQPAANQYRSTGTLTADASIGAVEHGLFTTSGTGSGTLWDRSVYTIVNLASGDSIQTQYTVTFTAGG
jgi:hypothetical protein